MKKFFFPLILFFLPVLCNAKIVGEVGSGNIYEYYETVKITNSEVIKSNDSDLSNIEKLAENKFRIYSKPAFFYDNSSGLWYDVAFSTTTKDSLQLMKDLEKDNELLNFLKILPANAQYSYPFATGWGTMYKGSAVWATARDATSGLGVVLYENKCLVYNVAGQYYLEKSFHPFDISSLPAGTITDASLNIYVKSVSDTDNDTEDYLVLVESTQSDYDTLIQDDYDTLQSVEWSQEIDLSTVTAYQTLEFNLNATALTYINATSTPKFGIREGHDLENSAIQANQTNGIYIINSYLDITFEAEATATATTTTNIAWDDDITKIVAWHFNYTGTNTDATSSISKIVYDIPFLKWVLIIIPFFFVSIILLQQMLKLWARK